MANFEQLTSPTKSTVTPIVLTTGATYTNGTQDLAADTVFNSTLTTALDKAIDSITTYPGGNTISSVSIASLTTASVSAAPAILEGLRVNTTIATTAALILDGTTTVITVPVGTAAGTDINTHSGRFETSLNVSAATTAGAGEVTLFWRSL